MLEILRKHMQPVLETLVKKYLNLVMWNNGNIAQAQAVCDRNPKKIFKFDSVKSWKSCAGKSSML